MSLSLAFSNFWGKFGENEHMVQTLSIQDEEKWQQLLQDDSVIIKYVRIINQDILEVNVMKHEDGCEGG